MKKDDNETTIQPRPAVRDPLLVKFFAGDLACPPLLLRELEEHVRKWREKLATYREIEAHYFTTPETLSHRYRMQYLALRRGILDIEGWLVWAGEVQATLGAADT